jgi:hypothetical protein
MILIRFAISIFALALLGLAFSYSSAATNPDLDVVPTISMAVSG